VFADRGLLETTGGLLFLAMIMPVLYPLTVHNTWMMAACLFLIGFSGAMGFPLQPHLMDVADEPRQWRPSFLPGCSIFTTSCARTGTRSFSINAC
jgi:predicted MFS family arabinose efflux permease